MKKIFLSVSLVLACCFVFLGCIKNTPYVTSINPTMVADVGNYKFISSAVTPATIDTQRYDTSTTLVITGYSSDRVSPYDKIILTIADYNGVTGTFSIVQGQAGALYHHGTALGVAVSGIVAIKNVNSELISGYFSFNTDDGEKITNGTFTVGIP